jgi:hypothetical protein
MKKTRIKKYPFLISRTASADTVKISEAQVIVTHSPDKCAGRHCCIHNPSNHAMRAWTMYWRDDKGVMERLCPEHGVGHPDPDDAEFNILRGRAFLNVHGCCGCCCPAVIDVDTTLVSTNGDKPAALEDGS